MRLALPSGECRAVVRDGQLKSRHCVGDRDTSAKSSARRLDRPHVECLAFSCPIAEARVRPRRLSVFRQTFRLRREAGFEGFRRIGSPHLRTLRLRHSCAAECLRPRYRSFDFARSSRLSRSQLCHFEWFPAGGRANATRRKWLIQFALGQNRSPKSDSLMPVRLGPIAVRAVIFQPAL